MEITPASSTPRTTKVRNVKSAVPKAGEATETPVIKAGSSKPTASAKVAAKPKAAPAPRKRKAVAVAQAIATPDLRPMIATAAYYLAERRHFAPGYEMQDWLAAEHFIRSSLPTK